LAIHRSREPAQRRSVWSFRSIASQRGYKAQHCLLHTGREFRYSCVDFGADVHGAACFLEYAYPAHQYPSVISRFASHPSPVRLSKSAGRADLRGGLTETKGLDIKWPRMSARPGFLGGRVPPSVSTVARRLGRLRPGGRPDAGKALGASEIAPGNI